MKKSIMLCLIFAFVFMSAISNAQVTSYYTSFEIPDIDPAYPGTPPGMLIGPGPGQHGWSGGAQPGLTNWSAHSDADGVGERIVSTHAHTGLYSWHFERGYNSPGQGTPFSPAIDAAGQASSGASYNIFSASFWFKAADVSGDNSRIAITGGNPAGNDRSSNYLEIENISGSGVTVRTYDGVAGGGWGATELLIATGLSTTEWHHIEMTGTFLDGAYNDTWTYRVNGGAPIIGGAYFETARNNWGYGYEMTNRLKFQPRHDGYSGAYSGFYFDDIGYSVYNSAPIPEPGTMLLLSSGLIGLGIIGRIRRKKKD